MIDVVDTGLGKLGGGSRPRRAAVAFVLAMLAAATGGCSSAAARGVSFETLGVPRAMPPPGQSAIVVGWENEAREGWAISAVRIEGDRRDEWNAATQRPTVIALEPGLHPLQVVAELRPPGGGNVRRLRLATVQLQAAEAQAMICRVGVVGRDDGRRRPRVRCEALATAPGEPSRDELLENPYRLWSDAREPRDAGEAAPTGPAPQAPTSVAPPEAPAEPPRGELLGSPYERAPDDLSDRVRLLEVRLDRLERAVRELARSQRAQFDVEFSEP